MKPTTDREVEKSIRRRRKTKLSITKRSIARAGYNLSPERGHKTHKRVLSSAN